MLNLVVSARVKTGFLQALPFWVASLMVGIIAVIYSGMFSFAERQLESIFAWNKWSVLVVTPVCFVMAWWMVQRLAPGARGSGIPQVMAALELSAPRHEHAVGGLLSMRVIVAKIFSSLLMVFGGGAVGREGPTIQVAASLFYMVNKIIPSNWPRMAQQSYVLTGAAAGLAAAFNTPLGGMVFAMEELARIHIRFFRTALFVAVIIAGLTAQGLLGPYLYLGYPDVGHLNYSIFLGVAVTALLAGAGGTVMSIMILKVMRWRKKVKGVARTIILLTITGLVVAAVAIFFDPEIMGSGKHLMTSRLFTNDKATSWHTTMLRIIGPVIAFCTGGAGGIFAPSLAAGAGIGAWIADVFHVAGANANIMILSGMVGFLTGVTRTPFTCAILVLEMTDRHSVIFHLMLAAMFSYLAALLIDKHSLYDYLKKDYLHEARNRREHAESPIASPSD